MKKILTYAIVGLSIVAAAYIAVSFVDVLIHNLDNPEGIAEWNYFRLLVGGVK